MHFSAKTATHTCTQLQDKGLAIMSLRLTFGGAPGPYEWGVMSESICNLAMKILHLHDDDWDPNTLHAPNQELVPPAKLLGDDIPFAVGRKLILDIPMNPRGWMSKARTTSRDLREPSCLPFSHLLAQNIPSEPIPREEMAALVKLLVEAGLEETKTILGWCFDFRGCSSRYQETSSQPGVRPSRISY
ncbi:hypothetical protein ACHAXR_001342 [Thalassiosira sp. AJA248-18]